MKEKVLFVAGFVVVVVCVMYPNFSSRDLYLKHSLENRELCMRHANERTESPSMCSYVSMSADAAYWAARQESSGLNTLIILMFGGFSIRAYKVRSLSRELKELQDQSET